MQCSLVYHVINTYPLDNWQIPQPALHNTKEISYTIYCSVRMRILLCDIHKQESCYIWHNMVLHYITFTWAAMSLDTHNTKCAEQRVTSWNVFTNGDVVYLKTTQINLSKPNCNPHKAWSVTVESSDTFIRCTKVPHVKFVFPVTMHEGKYLTHHNGRIHANMSMCLLILRTYTLLNPWISKVEV